MQVSIETTSGLERRLTVGVAAEKVETEVNSRLQKAARTLRLDGFRPGKVPMKIVRQRFSAGVRREVVDELMSESFQQAVSQENLQLAGRPSIELRNLEAGQDLEYIATFEVFPEIELQDLNDLQVEKPQAEVADSDIDDMINVFQSQLATRQQVEREAREGDHVTVDYEASVDGEPLPDGSARNHQLTLGSGQLLEDFDAGIRGMSAGQEKLLQVTFPDDYHDQSVRGATAEFAVTLLRVEESVPAPVNQKLFDEYGVEEGGEEQFRLEIRQNMSRELDSAIRSFVKQQVMQALYEAHGHHDIPKAAVEQEVMAQREQAMQELAARTGQAKSELETELPPELFRERAERRIKLSLVIGEFIAHHQLEADAARVREVIEQMASTYQQPQQVIEWYYSNEEQLQQIENSVLEDQVVDKLLERASVTEIQCSYQEALNKAREFQQR